MHEDLVHTVWLGCRRPVEIHPVVRSYGFEIIGRVGSGHTFDAIRKPDDCGFLHVFVAICAVQSRLKEKSLVITHRVMGFVLGDTGKQKCFIQTSKHKIEAILMKKRRSLEQCPVMDETGMCSVKDTATLGLGSAPQRPTYFSLVLW